MNVTVLTLKTKKKLHPAPQYFPLVVLGERRAIHAKKKIKRAITFFLHVRLRVFQKKCLTKLWLHVCNLLVVTLERTDTTLDQSLEKQKKMNTVFF